MWAHNMIIIFAIDKLNCEDFEVFYLLTYFIFDLAIWKHTSGYAKNADFVSIILEYSRFFRLFRDFSYKSFWCTIIRFHHIVMIIKFYNGLSMSSRKNGSILKTSQNGILRGFLKLRRFTRNQIYIKKTQY